MDVMNLRLLLHAIKSHLLRLILLPPGGFLGLEISTAESWWVLGFVYIISLFTFESSIVNSLITYYQYVQKNNKKCMKRRKPYDPYCAAHVCTLFSSTINMRES